MKAGALAAALLATVPFAVLAQPEPSLAPSDAKHPTVVGRVSDGSQDAAAERRFVDGVSAADLAEAAMGRLAASRAQASAVVEFGRSVASDADQDRKVLAAAAGGQDAPSRALDAPHREMLSRLQALHGPEFDDAYLSAVKKDEGDTAKTLQQEAKGGTNQALVFYAQRQLPAMQAHVDEATDLQTRAPGHSKAPPDAVVDRGAMQSLKQAETARLKRHPGQ